MWQFIHEAPMTPMRLDVKMGVSGKGLCWSNHCSIFLKSLLSHRMCDPLMFKKSSQLAKTIPENFSTSSQPFWSAVIPIIHLDRATLIPWPWVSPPTDFMFFMNNCSIVISHKRLSARRIVKFLCVTYSHCKISHILPAVNVFLKLCMSCKYIWQHLAYENWPLAWKYGSILVIVFRWSVQLLILSDSINCFECFDHNKVWQFNILGRKLSSRTTIFLFFKVSLWVQKFLPP